MSDDNTIGISAEHVAGLTDDGKATLTAQLAKHYSTDQIERIMGKATVTTEKPVRAPFSPNSVQATSDPSHRPPVTAAGNEPYEKRLGSFKNLIGKVDASTLQEAAKAEGIAWSEITKDAPAVAPETLTLQQANEKLVATSGPFAGSSEPKDHIFTLDRQSTDGLEPDEVAHIDSMFRNALHASTVPVSLGQSIVSEAVKAANLYEGMDETTAALRYASEGAQLKRMGNADQIAKDFQYAYAKLPGDFKKVADEEKLFHTANSFAALANAGALMRVRDNRAKK